jgi:hypothetical protein
MYVQHKGQEATTRMLGPTRSLLLPGSKLGKFWDREVAKISSFQEVPTTIEPGSAYVANVCGTIFCSSLRYYFKIVSLNITTR